MGQTNFFSAEFERNRPRLKAVAHRMLGSTAEAEDAVQDAFVKAFTHIGTYRADLSFDAWFTRILINGCLDRRRSLARRDKWFTPMWDMVRGTHRGRPVPHAAGPSPEQALLADESRRKINKAIDDATLIDNIDERNQAWADVDRMVTETAAAIPYIWDDQANIQSADVAGVINKFNANWDLAFTSLKP